MYLVHFNLAFSNNIMNEVVLDINMLGLELIHVILGQTNSTMIIIINLNDILRNTIVGISAPGDPWTNE